MLLWTKLEKFLFRTALALEYEVELEGNARNDPCGWLFVLVLTSSALHGSMSLSFQSMAFLLYPFLYIHRTKNPDLRWSPMRSVRVCVFVCVHKKIRRRIWGGGKDSRSSQRIGRNPFGQEKKSAWWFSECGSQNIPLRTTASHHLATLLEMQILVCSLRPSGSETLGWVQQMVFDQILQTTLVWL